MEAYMTELYMDGACLVMLFISGTSGVLIAADLIYTFFEKHFARS
jgi:hypothetical protein